MNDWDRFTGPPPIIIPADGRPAYHADTGRPATPEELEEPFLTVAELRARLAAKQKSRQPEQQT